MGRGRGSDQRPAPPSSLLELGAAMIIALIVAAQWADRRFWP